MSVFVTREAGTLKAIFDFPMFNTALCDFTALIVNAAAGTVVFAFTVMVSPAAFSTPPTLQALNCLPLGAVKPQTGST